MERDDVDQYSESDWEKFNNSIKSMNEDPDFQKIKDLGESLLAEKAAKARDFKKYIEERKEAIFELFNSKYWDLDSIGESDLIYRLATCMYDNCDYNKVVSDECMAWIESNFPEYAELAHDSFVQGSHDT